jgi:succinoglycan biosynthesis protein ExoA
VVTSPAGGGIQARLVAWAAGHPFASSSRSVRTQPEGYADTVPFPVMRKQALLEAGGYNELLLRNQDNDMNQRLRALGFKLYVTGKTKCRYFARPSITSFLQYGFRSGLWNALSLRQNPSSLGLRHFAPFGFVTVLLVLTIIAAARGIVGPQYSAMAGVSLAAILALHLGAGTLAGLQVAARERTVAALWLAPLIMSFHSAYGLGTMRGFLLLFRPAVERSAPSLPESTKDPV